MSYKVIRDRLSSLAGHLQFTKFDYESFLHDLGIRTCTYVLGVEMNSFRFLCKVEVLLSERTHLYNYCIVYVDSSTSARNFLRGYDLYSSEEKEFIEIMLVM